MSEKPKKKKTLPEELKPTMWKPGVSGNPKGKPAVPDELKPFKPFTADTLQRAVTRTIDKTVEEIETIANDKQSKGLEAMIAAVIVQAVQNGNYAGLDFLMNRTIGKVKEQIDLQVAPTLIIHRLNGEKVELGVSSPSKSGEIIEGEFEKS